MQQYKNLSGESGVVAYEIRPDGIIIQFTSKICYLYTIQSAGKENIEKLHQLAKSGHGLSTFINQHLHNAFATKIDHPT